MKKLLVALLSIVSISALAREPFLSSSDLYTTGKTHEISDARAGGGGEDPHRELVALQVTDENGQLTSAKCTLANDKGYWSTTAPDTVKVIRSAGDLTIVCSKDGTDAHTLVISAGTTQVQPKHFHFQGDSDDSDDPVTVPYYNATITMSLATAVAAPPAH